MGSRGGPELKNIPEGGVLSASAIGDPFVRIVHAQAQQGIAVPNHRAHPFIRVNRF
jgi:hypothetical protein